MLHPTCKPWYSLLQIYKKNVHIHNIYIYIQAKYFFHNCQTINFTNRATLRFYLILRSRHNILKTTYFYIFKEFHVSNFPWNRWVNFTKNHRGWEMDHREILEWNSYRGIQGLPWMEKSVSEAFVDQRFSRGAPPTTSACVPHFHTSCIPSPSSAKENFHGLEHCEYRATIDSLDRPNSIYRQGSARLWSRHCL